MKHVLLLAVLMLGACASEEPSAVAEPSASEEALTSGAAGSGAGLLAVCSSATYCNEQKAFINTTSGTTWTWSSTPCGTSVPPWQGWAPGGRTIYSFLPANHVEHRQFNLSQQWNAIVHCECVGENRANCHF